MTFMIKRPLKGKPTPPPALVDRRDKLINQAFDAYHEGDEARALAKFDKVIREGERDVAIIEAAAFVANQARRWKEAARYWLMLHEMSPKRPGPINQHVNALIQLRRHDEAEAFCTEREALQEEDMAPLRDSLLIRINLAQGKVNEAHALADALHQKEGDDNRAMSIAQAFIDQGFTGLAEMWLDRIDPDGPLAKERVLARARLFYSQGNWQRADKEYAEVERIFEGKNARDARIFLARIAFNRGDLRLAEDRYGAVLKDTPDHGEAAMFFIRQAINDNDYEKARELLELYGHCLDAVTRINFQARVAMREDLSDSIGYYERGIEENEDNIKLRLGFVEFLISVEKLDQARTELDKALALDPDNFLLNRTLARILRKQGAPFLAQLAQVERALSLQPSDVNMLNDYGNLLASCNRRNDAIRHFEEAVEKVPKEPILWLNGAHHKMLDNRLEEAADFARRGVETLGAETAEELAYASRIFLAAGLEDEALKTTEKALAVNSRSGVALRTAVPLLMVTGNYKRAWELCRFYDEIHYPRRDERMLHAQAQCMAAFREVARAERGPDALPVDADNAIEPVEGLFPELLLDALVKHAEPDHSPDRKGVIQFTSSLGSGGAERQVAYVMQGFADYPLEGEEMALAVNALNPNVREDFFLPEIEATGATLYHFSDDRRNALIRDVMARHPEHLHTVRALAAMPPEVAKMAISFFARLVQERPRAVMLWQDAVNIAGAIAAIAAGVPHIIISTRSTRPVEIRRHRRYLHHGYHAILRYKGRVTVLNNSANGARDYEDWLGVDEPFIETFYNGYDFDAIAARTEADARERIRREHGIPEDALVIGGVLRFSTEKRPDLWTRTLIEAARKDDKVYGLVAGDGPMRGDLLELVEKEGLSDRIHMVGRQSPVEPWMQAMDVLFLSSETEGLPNVLIEAQSIGLPVASMNVGGAPEAMAAGETGILIEEGTPAAIADQLVELLEDGPRLDAFRRAAPQWVRERFSLATMVERLKGILADKPTGDAAAA
ncbi:glycosyltransferase [Sphingomicrobium astaxanthinifaciens]|uniref:glycosyltransferase n=1 Tax=Sphingomicrobium astaxanthinifaciens TaxID=1227949 RepID=UPI001FCB787B|nr:glycosyltransferase [Sphingomicrobium astaxanthinifaciens]MCJ7420795.1 glycosyltransferase [Sphingomicrobium astaxanthinifaciens]